MNDNQSFKDFWPSEERKLADRMIYLVADELKRRGVPYETVAHALFEFAVAEATGREEFVADESLTFRRTLALFRDRLNALIDDWDTAVQEDLEAQHHDASEA